MLTKLQATIIIYLAESKEPVWISKIFKQTDISSNGLYKSVKELSRWKIVQENKTGRKIILTLTDKGKLIAENLIKIKELIK